MVKNCGNPNRTFNNLIAFHRSEECEIPVYTDGSKFGQEDRSQFVGAAFWIPHLNIARGFKLNHITSSFAAEAVAIIRALEFTMEQNLMAMYKYMFGLSKPDSSTEIYKKKKTQTVSTPE